MPVTSNPSFHYIFCLSTLWPSHPLLRQGATDILVLESDSEPEVMSSQKDSGFGWGMMGFKLYSKYLTACMQRTQQAIYILRSCIYN